MKALKYLSIILILGSYSIMNFPTHAQEEKTENKVKFKIQTVRYLIDVVVLDDDDEHIINLKREDFQLFQNGVKQKILTVDEFNYLPDQNSKNNEKKTFLDKMKSKTEKTSHPAVGHIYLIANFSLGAKKRETFFEGFKGFINNNFRYNDYAAIYIVNNDGIRKYLDFTSDKRIIIAAANKLLSSNLVYRGNLPSNLIHNLKAFVSGLREIEGRKNVQLFSAGRTIPITYTSTEKRINLINRDDLAKSIAQSNIFFSIFDLASKKAGKRNLVSGGINRYSYQFSGGAARSTTEERLHPLEILAAVGRKKLYKRSLFSSSTLEDNLAEQYRINSHFYTLSYMPEGVDLSDDFHPVKVETTNEDAETVIHKKYVVVSTH